MRNGPGSTGLTFRDRQGHRIGTLSAPGVAAWLLVVVPILVVVERTLTSAPGAPWWPAVLVVLLAVGSADLPDSMFALATVVVAVTWWVVAVDRITLGSTVTVALALLVFHVAVGHAALGPPGRADDRAVLRGVVSRTALVGALTVGLAALAAATAGRVDVPTGVLAPALLVTGALPWFARHLVRPKGSDH